VAGFVRRPSAANVLATCAPFLDGDQEVVAFVVGRTVNGRLLYVVTERAVHVLRLGSGLGGRLNPKEQLGTWRRGEVETEDGIASVLVGPYRAKVGLLDRRRASEVARLAAMAG
jgi:hypothetical protein